MNENIVLIHHKRIPYSSPDLIQIQLDNEISLVMVSDPQFNEVDELYDPPFNVVDEL